MIFQEIQTSLDELEQTASSNEENDNRTPKNKFAAKCFVETDGKVNCSDIIYEDEKSWRKSRHQIDVLIHVLKNKILELKDIRRHLNDHRPATIRDEQGILEPISEEISTEGLPKIARRGPTAIETSPTKRNNRHHNNYHHNHHHAHHNHNNNTHLRNITSLPNTKITFHSDDDGRVTTLSLSTITMNPSTITTIRSVAISGRAAVNAKNSTTHSHRGMGNARRTHKENSSRNGTLHENEHRKNTTRHVKHPVSTNRTIVKVNTALGTSTAAPTKTTPVKKTTLFTTSSTTVSPFTKEDNFLKIKEYDISENSLLSSSTTLRFDIDSEINGSTQGFRLSSTTDNLSKTINSNDDTLTSTRHYESSSSSTPHHTDLDEHDTAEQTECFCEPEVERLVNDVFPIFFYLKILISCSFIVYRSQIKSFGSKRNAKKIKRRTTTKERS